MEDISAVAARLEARFKLTIVGEGNYLRSLKAYSSQFTNYELCFVRHLEETDLNEFLVKDVDVMFGMGTSALEGAKLGVPTVLLDLSYKNVPGTYEYRWLYERDGSTLGDTLRDFSPQGCSQMSLSSLIADFIQGESDVSKKTYSYFLKNHSLEVVTGKLFLALAQSACFWGELRSNGLVKSGVVYNLFYSLRKKVLT